MTRRSFLVRLDDDEHDSLRLYSLSTGMSMNDIVRAALVDYLNDDTRRQHMLDYLSRAHRTIDLQRDDEDQQSSTPAERRPG